MDSFSQAITMSGQMFVGSSPASSSISSSSSSSFSTAQNFNNTISPPTSDEFDFSTLNAANGGMTNVVEQSNDEIDNVATTKEDELNMMKKLKPHKCEVCGSCFARKVHLQRHSLRHQNGKPYCCDLCGKCFSRQDSLVRHHRLLHDNIPIEGGKLGSSASGSSQKQTTIKTVKLFPKKKSQKVSNKRASSSQPIPIGGQEDVDRKLNVRQRNDSIATSTSSMVSMVEDDESSTSVMSESPSWTNGMNGFCHGPRSQSTSSLVSSLDEMSGWTTLQPTTFIQQQQQIQPHPFELPQLVNDSMFAGGFDLKNFDVNNNAAALSAFLPNHQFQQQFQFQQAQQQQANALFDWCSFVVSQQQQQFVQQQQQNPWVSESASNKDLNETLLSGDLHMAALSQDTNDFVSFQQQQQPSAVNSNSWDGLMRSFSASSTSSNNSSSNHHGPIVQHQQFQQLSQQV